MTPCPYLPVFGGNLKNETMNEIWNESELFMRIRQRNKLNDRCGECEFNGICGGCRARSFGATGDYMAEDPICDFKPGKYSREAINNNSGLVYGLPHNLNESEEIAWRDDAKDRMKEIPAFVRGMVKKSVESYCHKNNIHWVTGDVLSQIRKKMPTPKIFGKK